MSAILTLRFDAVSQQFFEEMRQRYFPPERNLVPAHLTLFHTLPETEAIYEVLESTAGAAPIFPVEVTGLRSLGRGVAFTLTAPPLLALHKSMAHSFGAHLTRQDQQKFQPHVVIQNKSTGEKARALLSLLQAQFRPFSVEAQGLDLWEYQHGPWELTQQFDFIR